MTPIASSCLVAALAVPACRSNGWQAAPSMLAPPRDVAAALGEPLRPEADGIDPSAIPLFDPPSHVRACCQLGMDLHLKAGDVQIPGYQRGNVTQVGDLGHHVYDGGLFPVYEDSRGTGVEQNGIVYTCRGGFADTAHIRDYADWTFFLGLRLSRSLPEGTTVVLPGDGAIRRIVVRALPWALVADRGRFAVAATLAQWLAFRIAIWHEIATWFGWESFRGFPEKHSAFSPEDMYSNALGIKLGAALVARTPPRTREDYETHVDAWIAAILERLGPVPREDGRAAMSAVDGLWWDSRKVLPDNCITLRRNISIGPEQLPWTLGDALKDSELPPGVRAECKGSRGPLPLRIPESIGDVDIASVASLELDLDDWSEQAGFPFPRPPSRSLTSADFPALADAARAGMQRALGDDCDHPGKVEEP